MNMKTIIHQLIHIQLKVKTSILVVMVFFIFSCEKEDYVFDLEDINEPPIIDACDHSNRPQVFAQLTPLGSLSKSRVDYAVASIDTKILFSGGSGTSTSDCPECWGSSRVDIYDTVTQEWSIAELSEGRRGIATAVLGDKIFFAGGANGDGAFDQLFSTVDIYDASTGNWTVTNLSQPRAYIAAEAVGNKVLFAGGEKNWNYDTSNIIDIYDLATNTWSTNTLSEARAYISAVSVNDKVYFAGGHKEDRWYNDPSDNIDIYDNASGNWTTASLSQPMGIPGGIATNENIYWASGCDVEIKNINTWNSNIANLFNSGESFFNNPNVVIKDYKIIFLRISYDGIDKFDIYDIISNTWSIGILPIKVYGALVFMVDNGIYLVGKSGGSNSKLWKLEI